MELRVAKLVECGGQGTKSFRAHLCSTLGRKIPKALPREFESRLGEVPPRVLMI